MPWLEATSMSLKREFVTLADSERMSDLCRRFNISRKTGYKWRSRFQQEGVEGLKNRSRRPWSLPWKTDPGTVNAVLMIRDHHPAWGGRKIRHRLLDLGFVGVTAASTITEILLRAGCLRPEEAEKHAAWQRFEQKTANDLWQMDFKGHFLIGAEKCFPLTALDDYSLFALLLEACPNPDFEAVQVRLVMTFARYGLPRRILTDKGVLESIIREGAIGTEETDNDLGRKAMSEFLGSYRGDPINRMLFCDTKFSPPNDMLAKVDLMSLRNSLEVRVPFLDHRIVEYAFRLPGHLKLKWKRGKYILLETFREILPAALHSRPKWGFEIPIGKWLKSDLKFLLDEHLSEERIKKQGIFNFEAVRPLINNLLGNRKDTSWQLWNLIVFQSWSSRYLRR